MTKEQLNNIPETELSIEHQTEPTVEQLKANLLRSTASALSIQSEEDFSQAIQTTKLGQSELSISMAQLHIIKNTYKGILNKKEDPKLAEIRAFANHLKAMQRLMFICRTMYTNIDQAKLQECSPNHRPGIRHINHEVGQGSLYSTIRMTSRILKVWINHLNQKQTIDFRTSNSRLINFPMQCIKVIFDLITKHGSPELQAEITQTLQTEAANLEAAQSPTETPEIQAQTRAAIKKGVE